jgi:hypothetical protein
MARSKVVLSSIKWTLGNAKLEKTSGGKYKVLGFGITADATFVDNAGNTVNTCPSALACKGVCYGKQGRYVMPNVANARSHNIGETLSPTFVDSASSDLTHYASKGYNVVRVHDVGDFYSQAYLDSWYAIARKLPNMTFYAYTKSLNLDLWTNKPSNFQLVQSLGGVYDKILDYSLPHSRIFSSEEGVRAAGYVDGSDSDIPAIEGITNIALVYHGTRKLTVSQSKYFA